VPSKSDPTVRRLLTRWRALTGGAGGRDADRRTLVAFSGGSDSSALLLALSTQARHVVAAHIVHDMRSEADAQADRAACEQLCRTLGVPFVTRRISVQGRGNIEAAARRERYRALAELARDAGCRFVATGHHAEDQLETLLMRLLRGSGPRGLRGIAIRRALDRDITLIRPMLELRHTDAERLCSACGWMWRTDATNADTTRLRAKLRHEVIPLLEAIAPGVAERSSSLATAAAAAFGVIRVDAAALLRDSRRSPGEWSRGPWQAAPRAVVAEAVTQIVRSVHGTPRNREVLAAARAARSRSGEAKRFQFEGCTLIVEAAVVRVEA
jgi:tRNA(Ile)-lysidine synthase